MEPTDNRVKIAGADIDGIARGKVISADKFKKIIKSGMGFCDVVFGWDCLDKLYSFETKTDFSDICAIPDLNTFRRIPWEGDMPFFILDFYSQDKKLLEFAPRSVLKKIVGQLNGFTALAGMEYEWYNFKETSSSLQKLKGVGLEPLTAGMFGYSITRTGLNQDYFTDIFESCAKFNIPIEGIHTETGPGVYEVALEYTDILEMADRSHLFKTSVKSIAQRHGITACFMAKPHANLPGCSGHIHFSLKNLKTGKNEFSSTVENHLCSSMKVAVAGLLYTLPSMMAIYAPTINSYKRLVENYWAPVTVSFGFENRTSSLRIICPPYCEPDATRIEIRVPGADVNPYLALAAILGSVLYGIENNLELNIEPSVKDKVRLTGERLPRNLKEATNKMAEENSPARKILGNIFVDHYCATRYHECKEWDQAITNWEVRLNIFILIVDAIYGNSLSDYIVDDF